MQELGADDTISDARIRGDRDGTITGWNAAAERIFGYAAAEAIGKHASIIAPRDMIAQQAELLSRGLLGEVIQNFETVRRAKSGAYVPVSVNIAPIRDGNSHVVGVEVTARELTDQYRAELTARRLAAIVESSDDAIVSKNLQGIVMSWNRAAERMFGYSADEMIGKSIRRIVPDDRQHEEDEVLARVSRGDKVDHFETIRRRKDGAMIPISLTVSPIRDAAGMVVGASKIARDVTARREADAERSRLLLEAQEQAEVTAKLNEVGELVSATLDRNAIIQAVTDAATSATGAEFGAFFYNEVHPDSGEKYQLYTLSGAPLEAFASFPHPRATAIFAPTFHGEGVVRLDDVTRDPRYGQSPPFHGMPAGHLPVRSYLAVPVKARSGEVLGGLFFGHSATGRFVPRHERLVEGIASWASIALENARLYVAAHEANRVKDEFLATLSHELRTPLNAILGYARMLRSGLMAGDKQPRAFEAVERNAHALTQIVEDVLDISRIVAGKIRLNVQTVQLPDVVRHAVDAVRPAADAKGIRIDMVLEPHATPVAGDPDRLQQVFWNILSNSVKFTPKGGRVQVVLKCVNSHVELSITDNGIGITAGFLPYVFERFRQADGGIDRERGGLGLGLSIAKHLMEMHGGTIDAESPGEHKGSTFRMRLPVMAATPMKSRDEQVHPRAPARETAFPVPNLEGVRVLVVDDDRDALRLVREILEVAGADVITAESAQEALGLAGTQKPTVLIADLGLPHMDGFELIKRIREHHDPSVRQLRAAALTAYARSEDRTRALRSGFHLHLAKPIDPGELLAAVESLSAK